MTPTTVRPSLTVDEVLIDDLRPNPVNPGRISDEELDSLERSLRQFGFVQPVLARREDRTVIGGHQRLVERVRSHGCRGRADPVNGLAPAASGSGRVQPSASRANSAARRTARRMLGYVQQRQMLPSRADLICASSGSASCSSSATVLMIMLAVQ
jgi:hypothetical protein